MAPVQAVPTDGTAPASGEGLRAVGLAKSYAGNPAVRHVDLLLTHGSVLGLVGENGAGKSTTSGMLAGLVSPDAGVMTLDGAPYAPKSPGDALTAGVALIHQEIRMVPELSVAENIFLGRLPMRRGRVDRRRLDEEARAALEVLGSHTDPRRTVHGLSMAAQQEIEIARAITRDPRFVIFDEPSASLGQEETERIFEQIAVLRDRGAGIVYISHRLDEVTRICDAITCLRDGSMVASWDTGAVPKSEIMSAMVGREFVFGHTAPKAAKETTALEVRGLGRTGAFEGVSFSVQHGEIFGIAGLIGAGRTEMVRTIAGADRATAGEVLVDGVTHVMRTPGAAISAGVAMVPEDRKGQGLNLDRTGEENISLPWERSLARRGLVTRRVVKQAADAQRGFLDIRGRLDIPVGSLSGGNQQKILLGKWLVEDPKVLILDEPTRGVDVGAKMKIYEIIRALAESGVAVIVVSSELEEVLGLAHRVLVMAGGRQQAIFDRSEATPERVIELAFLHSDTSADEADATPLAS